MTNVVRNARRHEARRAALELPDLATADAGPMLAAERAELVALLRTQIDALPPEQRQVLRLQLQHDMSPVEIAEALEVPPGTVRMRIHPGCRRCAGCCPRDSHCPCSRRYRRAADGGVVVQRDMTELDWSLRGFHFWELDHVFPFGLYEVEAYTDAGWRYRATFAVRENLGDPTRIDVPWVER